MRFVIESTSVQTKKGEKNGRAWEMREQEALVEVGKERRLVKLTLQDGAQPYAVGAYELDAKSFTTDRYDQLTFRRLLLKPIVASARATA